MAIFRSEHKQLATNHPGDTPLTHSYDYNIHIWVDTSYVTHVHLWEQEDTHEISDQPQLQKMLKISIHCQVQELCIGGSSATNKATAITSDTPLLPYIGIRVPYYMYTLAPLL